MSDQAAMSTEDRAVQLWKNLYLDDQESLDMITAAIEAAENDALERAAKEAHYNEPYVWDDDDRTLEAAAYRIRRLKHGGLPPSENDLSRGSEADGGHINDPEEIEIVARAMCDGNWDAVDFNQTANGEDPEEQREYWREKAREAITALDQYREGRVVTIDREVAAAGLDRIQWYFDEGPQNEGWQSKELGSFIYALETALAPPSKDSTP